MFAAVWVRAFSSSKQDYSRSQRRSIERVAIEKISSRVALLRVVVIGSCREQGVLSILKVSVHISKVVLGQFDFVLKSLPLICLITEREPYQGFRLDLI